MTDLFLAIVKASFQGSIVILAVFALRLLLKKAPKSLFCLLWLLAGLRLVLPFEIESRLSLQPKLEEQEISIQAQQPVQVPDILIRNPESQSPDPLTTQTPTLPEGNPDNPQLDGFLYKVEDGIALPLTWTDIAVPLWLLGIGAMLSASAVSYWKLKRRVREAYLIENGCFECPGLANAFVLGFLPPKVYLPTGLSDREKSFIFDHENTHIARGDHWYKLLGYVVLSIHWFNPVVWIGYGALCRDIELACDEHVVRNMSLAQRKAYSAALLSCGGHTARIAACPVAFGESNPRKRILNVLNYKRPTFWITLLAVIAVIFVSVCLLTSPAEEQFQEESDADPWNLQMQMNHVSPSGATVEFIQSGPFQGYDRAELHFGSDYTLEKWTGENWEPVEILPQEHAVVWTTEAYIINRGGTTQQQIDWEWLYGQLSPGRYMLGKSVDLFRGVGENEIRMFWAEFSIAEDAVPDAGAIAQCREAMLRLKNSEALSLYVQSLDDPNGVTNLYMKSPSGWLFQYRRPLWDYEYVTWLRYGENQYLYGGDMDQDGIMNAPYYWQVETRPESHDFQLPYPFDLEWERIELTYGGTVSEGGQTTVTLNFPPYMDVFHFTFSSDDTLLWFDIGDTSGEPEATANRCYILSTDIEEVDTGLSDLYREAVFTAGQKPGIPDEAAFQELFSRAADGAYATMWVSDLYTAFYADPAGFVSRLSVHDRAEEILECMYYEVDIHAPYYFDQVLSRLEQSGNPNIGIIEKMKRFTGRNVTAQQPEDVDLNDQIAWLAQCAIALESYQSQGSWVLLADRQFSGEDTMAENATELWYIHGEDRFTQCVVSTADSHQESWELKKDGTLYSRVNCIVHDSENGENTDTGWVEEDTADRSLPWPLEYRWKGADIAFAAHEVTDGGDVVRFVVQGNPHTHTGSTAEEYQVTFWLRSSGAVWKIRLEYTETWQMRLNGQDPRAQTRTTVTYDLHAAAPEEAEKMIERKYQEITG